MTDLKWHNEGLDAQRERIATAAMAALIPMATRDNLYKEVAEAAAKYADALIKELNSGS